MINQQTEHLNPKEATADPVKESPDGARKLLFSIAITILARGGSIGGLLILTPLLTRQLGSQSYGILVSVATVTTLVSMADLGVGNGAISELAGYARHTPCAQRLLKETTVVLIILGGSTFALMLLLLRMIPWDSLIRTTGPPSTVTFQAVCLALPASAVLIVTSLGQKIDIARQRGHQLAIWTSASSVVGPVGALCCASIGAPLSTIALAYVLCPALIQGLRTGCVLRDEEVHLRLKDFRRVHTDIRRTIRRGVPYLGLAVVSTLSFSIDTLLISALLGAAEAGQFSVTIRLFSGVNSLIQSAVTQLWGSFAIAINNGDYVWARRMLLRTTAAALGVGALVQAVLALLTLKYMSNWLGDEYSPETMLVTVAAFWYLYALAIQPLSMFLNGARLQRKQLLVAMPVLFINIPVSFFLTKHIGLAGPLAGSLFANALLMTPLVAILARKHLSQMEQDCPILEPGQDAAEVSK